MMSEGKCEEAHVNIFFKVGNYVSLKCATNRLKGGCEEPSLIPEIYRDYSKS